MTRLTLHLFGPPHLEVDTAPIGALRRKALALFAYLAVTRQSHTREALATLFWPETDPSRAYANLRHILWEINQAVGEGEVWADRDTISLNPDVDLWLDVAQFQMLLAEARQVGQDCGACMPMLIEAAALYQDHFLAGFNLKETPTFDEWVFFEAESLRRDLAGALEMLVRCQGEQGQAEAAIPFARRWLALDPLNEAAHCQLMLVYEQAGQHNAVLRQYQECVRILRDELDVEPQPETTALYEKLRAEGGRRKEGTPFISIPVVRSNLPAQLTSFIGREKEMTELKRLLSPLSSSGRGKDGDAWPDVPGNRLVTLTGPGGTGKTRLSLQVAIELLDAFPNGVWLVELAPLADPALVSKTVAVALDLRGDTGRPVLDALIDHLRAKTALLILDNCEHLVEACAQLAETLLRQCPDLRVLASSREVLAVPGERVYRVPSLSFPLPHAPGQASDLQSLLQYESTRLFVERAVTALPGFSVTNDNASAIAQICYQLDGIPLAIELAAARVQMLTVEQIAARLDDRFRLLTGGSRTALARHQTLRALIDWSYDLLSEPECILLRRLSVFAGGWTLEAAEAVVGDWTARQTGVELGDSVINLQYPKGTLSPISILDLLTQLVNKSLVLVERTQGEEVRYRLLETIRQYAREKLEEAGEADQMRHQHLAYFLNLAEQAELELIGPRQVAWLRRLDDELDNIRAALEWSLESNPSAGPSTSSGCNSGHGPSILPPSGAGQGVQAGLRLAGALLRYWEAHSPLCDGVDWLLQLLRQPEASIRNEARAKALIALSSLIGYQSEFAEARSLAEEGLALYRELGDQQGIAFALCVLGSALCLQDGYEAGRPLMLESLALYKMLGDKFGISEVMGWLGGLGDNQDYARARAYLEESLALCRELGHVACISGRLNDLGLLALRHGDYASARPWLTESLEIQRSLSIAGVAYCIETLGELALHEGQYEQARAYLEESVSLSRETGQTITTLWALTRLGYVVLRQGDQIGAYTLFLEGQRRFKEIGSKIGVVYALEGLASLAVAQDRPERAVRLLAWADAMREAIGDRRPPVEQADVDCDFALIRAQLDEAIIAAAYAEGQAMTMEQVIAYVLES